MSLSTGTVAKGSAISEIIKEMKRIICLKHYSSSTERSYLDWAKRGTRLPVVLTTDEVRALFSNMSGTGLLMAQVLYGSGLRLMELARLRVQDKGC